MDDYSSGPVSSLPSHTVGATGNTCDCGKPAIVRVQGETDSFGCEYLFLCAECNSKRLSYVPEDAACAMCGSVARLFATRDPDEGLSGPVYQVCARCRRNLLTIDDEAF